MEIKDYFLEQNLGNITDEELDRKIILKDWFTLEEYIMLFADIEEKVKEEDFRLIIIDNIAGVWEHFIHQDTKGGSSSVDYLERASFLQKQANTLKTVAYKYNIAVITINNVVADMLNFGEGEDEASKMYNDKLRGRNNQVKPALGLVWSACINDRICFRKTNLSSSSISRKMSVDQSSHWPHNVMDYEITNAGLRGKP
jgi:hypothetical protein